MSGKVQFTGVLHEQHGVGLPGLLARGLPMRLAEGSMGHIRLVQQTVGRLQLMPGANLLRQVRLRARGQGGTQFARHGKYGAHRPKPPYSTAVAPSAPDQKRNSEPRAQTKTPDKMWVRTRPSGEGFPPSPRGTLKDPLSSEGLRK